MRELEEEWFATLDWYNLASIDEVVNDVYENNVQLTIENGLVTEVSVCG